LIASLQVVDIIIDTEIYIGVPERMDIDPKNILKLRRSLYGLKLEGPRIWWEKMGHFLLKVRLSLL
jgi:hypothetical protein